MACENNSRTFSRWRTPCCSHTITCSDHFVANSILGRFCSRNLMPVDFFRIRSIAICFKVFFW